MRLDKQLREADTFVERHMVTPRLKKVTQKVVSCRFSNWNPRLNRYVSQPPQGQTRYSPSALLCLTFNRSAGALPCRAEVKVSTSGLASLPRSQMQKDQDFHRA